MLNFSSQSYFISVFKSVTGTTPKEFRRRHG
nr:AraC family transcriptional regulator [uncultured Blautia sp.]